MDIKSREKLSRWDNKFIDLAVHVSGWSRDRGTKNGAVIVDSDNIVLSMGYNGFPRGCDDHINCRYEKPEKYFYTEHAERNAIYHGARHGVPLRGCSIYVTMMPCADCARAIIQSGIKKVISPVPNFKSETWGRHFEVSIELFKECGVDLVLYGE